MVSHYGHCIDQITKHLVGIYQAFNWPAMPDLVAVCGGLSACYRYIYQTKHARKSPEVALN